LVTAIAPEAVYFRLLDPQWLAVAAFVALPGLAVLVVVVLVERWLAPDVTPPRPVVLAIAAVTGTMALVLAAASASSWVRGVWPRWVPRGRGSGRGAGRARDRNGRGAWVTIDEASQILG